MEKTLVEPGRYEGHWWLPGAAEDAKVPGALVIGDDGALELQLIGALGDELDHMEAVATDDGSVIHVATTKSMAKGGTYPRILGEVGSSRYTLEDCFQKNLTNAIFGGLKTQRIHVHQAFSRVHFEEDENPEFSAVVVQFGGIEHWVNETGIAESHTFVEGESERKAIDVTSNRLEARNLDTKTFAGVEGSMVSIEHVYTIKGDRLVERGLSQHFNVRVKPSTPSIQSSLMSQVSIIQDLVTVAINRPAGFVNVTLRHEDVVLELGEKSYPQKIGVAANWVVPRGTESPIKSHRIIFTLADMGGDGVFEGWMHHAYVHRTALARVMTMRYSSTLYATDNLMNCAAAIEAYDRDKHGDAINYVDRVKRSIAHVGPRFEEFVGDSERWAKVVRDGRNRVAHQLSGIGEGTTKEVLVSRSAFWLLILCLLKDSGAPDDLFEKILGHVDLRWLKEQLDDALSAP